MPSESSSNALATFRTCPESTDGREPCFCAERHRLGGDDVAGGREKRCAPQDLGARRRHCRRVRPAPVVGLVEAHLAEVVQQRGGLDLRELVPREAELRGDGHGERGNAVGVTGADDATELGGRAQRADRLVVRATDLAEVLVRVPGREQRDREHERSPETHALRRP